MRQANKFVQLDTIPLNRIFQIGFGQNQCFGLRSTNNEVKYMPLLFNVKG